jgi:hypothetical protein
VEEHEGRPRSGRSYGRSLPWQDDHRRFVSHPTLSSRPIVWTNGSRTMAWLIDGTERVGSVQEGRKDESSDGTDGSDQSLELAPSIF